MINDMNIKCMRRGLFMLVTLFSFLGTTFAGGGWTPAKGKGYFKLSEWWLVSDQHYTDAGLIDPNITTGIFNTTIYAEYGFTDRLTGVVYFPLFSRAITNNVISATTSEVLIPGESLNSIGDTDISLKYALTKPGSNWAMAATVMVGLPLGNDSGGTQNNLQTGDGELNQLVRFDASTSFRLSDELPAYFSTYTAFNNRTNGFSDEWRIGGEIGAGFLNQKLWVNAKLDIVTSLKNGIPSGLSNSTSIFANNAEFTGITTEVAYKIQNNWGVSVAYGSALSGKIILASPSYSIGVFVDLN